MTDWRSELKSALAAADKVAVLGAGSVLCGDDAAGMIVAARLKEKGSGNDRLLALEGSTAPENFSGVIRDFQPDLMLLVDAAYIEGETGDIGLIDPDDIETAELGLSTHMLPFKMLFSYLTLGLENCHIKIVGIKPENVDFATEASPAVQSAAEELADWILANLK